MSQMVFSSNRLGKKTFGYVNAISASNYSATGASQKSQFSNIKIPQSMPVHFGQEPVKRYKGNTPNMFDLMVTGLFTAISGMGYLVTTVNPFIGVPMLAIGGFGAVRQVMHNFVHRTVKAGMA